MELEFDKEIDAILRKARGQPGAAVASEHIDADAIAAFAENALPDRVKKLYTTHFADCGRCRKLLSGAIMTRTAVATTAEETPIPVIGAPWYSRLFRMPSLAVAMGVLVLTFGGVLGYLVLQNREAASRATVAQSSQPATVRDESPAANNMSSANTNAAVANTSVVSEPSDGLTETSSNQAETGRTTGPSPVTEERESDRAAAVRQEAAKETQAADSTGVSASAPAVAAPQKPAEKKVEADAVAKTQPEGIDAKAAKDDSEKSKQLAAGARSADESRARRDAPPPASKSGPARSGPVQMQSNQVNQNVGEMAVTRTISGKTFNNRERVWYDSAYRGQPTINVRRGTDEFRKLDSGLRSIANNLGGVVVVVWKQKAYRIQ